MHQDESFLPATTMPVFYYRGIQGQPIQPSSLNPTMPGMSGMAGLGAAPLSKATKYGGIALSVGVALLGLNFALKGQKLPGLIALAAGASGALYLATAE